MIIRERKFYSYFFSLAIPIMLQNVVVFGVNLMDNIMIGGYSELSISAVAVANQVQFVLQMLTLSISDGIIVLSSQYWGQNRTDEMKRIIGIGMKFQLMLAVIFFTAIYFFPQYAVRIITPDPEVIAEAVVYLRIMAFTYVFFCMTGMLVASMRVVEVVRIGFVINVSALVIKIILNYILIYGHFGAPAMGIRGAAIATLVSRVAEFAIAIVYILKFDQKLKLRVRDLLSLDFSFLKDFLRVGMPIIAAGMVWAFANVAQGAILGRLGARVLAANSISGTLFSLIYVASGAMATVSGVVIGKTVGEGDAEKVKSYARTLQLVYLAVGVLSGLMLFVSRGLVLSLYNISADTYNLANSFLLVLCVTIIGSNYQVPCLTGIVRGGGDTKFVLINDTIFQWLIVLPSSALAAFVFHLPPIVVFMFLKSDQILKCFVALVKVNRFRWIKVLTR